MSVFFTSVERLDTDDFGVVEIFTEDHRENGKTTIRWIAKKGRNIVKSATTKADLLNKLGL